MCALRPPVRVLCGLQIGMTYLVASCSVFAASHPLRHRTTSIALCISLTLGFNPPSPATVGSGVLAKSVTVRESRCCVVCRLECLILRPNSVFAASHPVHSLPFSEPGRTHMPASKVFPRLLSLAMPAAALSLSSPIRPHDSQDPVVLQADHPHISPLAPPDLCLS